MKSASSTSVQTIANSSSARHESTKPSLLSRKPPSHPSPVDYERIKQRVLDLVEMLLAAMEAAMEGDQQSPVVAMGPVILLMISSYETTKLHLLLTCLSAIASAVVNLDCSAEQYEALVEPIIEQMAQAL